MFNVLLADDQVLVREGLKGVLRRIEPATAFVEASTFAEAMAPPSGAEPNLIVIDPSIPGMNGIEGLRPLRSRFASAPLLVFAERLPSSEASIAQSLGATVCADKAATVEQITVLLAALLRGNVAKNIVLQPQHEAVHPALIRLTGREREVLAVLADGCTNRDIGRRLNMQEATAKAHMRQIFKKLGVSNRTQAAALALRLRDYH